MSKKYKLTDETLEHYGRTLHRIAALKDFGNVHKGDKGGWVEKEENLSQEGKCWVYGEAKVYDDAQVYNDAQVSGEAQVYSHAKVWGKAKVYGNAQVRGWAKVHDAALVYFAAKVYGQAQVYENAEVGYYACVYNMAEVYGDARVYGNAEVFGEAKVYGNAHVNGNAILGTGTTQSEDDYVVIGPQGSRHSYTTYHIPSDTVCTGCFKGTLDAFEAAVEATHKSHPKYLKQYKWVISIFNLAKADLTDADLTGVVITDGSSLPSLLRKVIHHLPFNFFRYQHNDD